MNTRQYHTDDVISFRKTNEKFGGLSNMAAGFSLNINGIIVRSAEHLYQAMRFPVNPEIQQEILSEYSPMTAKMISKKYRDKYTRPDWDKVRISVMRWILEVKLSQNWETFGHLLLETGDKAIVEVSPNDRFWGAVVSGDIYEGTNALGRLLMDIREKYVKTHNYHRCIEPLDIPAFLLYNQQIEIVCNDSYHEEILQSELMEMDV